MSIQGQVEQASFVNNLRFNYRGNQNLLSYNNNRNVLQPPPGFNNQISSSKIGRSEDPSLKAILATFIGETRVALNLQKARFQQIETIMG